MAKKFPLHPKHPERICWGCDRYCPQDSLGCGNGSGRTQHPAELLGEDWYLFGDWGLDIPDALSPDPLSEPNAVAPVNSAADEGRSSTSAKGSASGC